MMPEVEDLTMHLAEVARIEVVPHTLMRMADDTYAILPVELTGLLPERRLRWKICVN